MIERCFDTEQGFYWAVSAGSVEEFQRKVQPVPFILPDGSEVRPGMTTDLLGYNFKPAEYVGLMKVCKEFESYFLEQVFKEMNKTIPKSEYQSQSTSNLVDYFKDNTIQKLASDSTEQNSLGLAQMLYEQMKRNYDM